MRPPGRGFHLRLYAIWLALLTLALHAPAAGQGDSAEGVIRITGSVTDANGEPLPDLRVVLEASHRAFEFKRLDRVTRGTTRQTSDTDANGRYDLRWTTDPYFNHFELLIGMTVRVPQGEQFYTLERMPLSVSSGGEGQLTVDAVVADTTFLERYRLFVATLDSEDEREVYEQMGIPEKIDRKQLGTHQEISWWYFEVGKAYRFEAGRLAEVIDFEPVTPFGESETRQ